MEARPSRISDRKTRPGTVGQRRLRRASATIDTAARPMTAPAMSARIPANAAAPAINTFMCVSLVVQDLADRCNRIPVTGCHRNAEDAIQRAQTADGLHVPPVHSDKQPVLSRE